MNKLLPGGLVLVFLGTAGVGLYAARIVRSLDTPEFRIRVAEEASSVVGARVQIRSLDVSLLRGIRLGGVRVQNPPGFSGDLVTVEGASLSYDLWPLLLGRVQVNELGLRKPVITLATDARGEFNYQKLSALAPAPQKAPAPSAASAGFLRLAVSKLWVKEGRFAVVGERKAAVLRLEGASLDAALGLESGVVTGSGKAGLDTLVLANALFLRGVRAPLKLTKERMSLAPLQARLAGGAVTGEIKVDFKPELRYALKVAVQGANVARLIEEAGGAGTMTGALDAQASIEGTGGVTTIRGAGNAEIRDCRWPKAALFGLLAGVLQIPELGNPRFDECRVQFTLGGGLARTPVVDFKGPALELTGQGVTNLVTSALDYDLTLALSPGLLAKAPGTVRAAFKTRSDGFATIAFKVSGAAAAPRTDLTSRFGKAIAIEAAKEGLLGRLFGGKKKPQ
jgi:uncharacterized protein involved in outer membrane biogenesis